MRRSPDIASLWKGHAYTHHSRPSGNEHAAACFSKEKMITFFDLCKSSLRRGHFNLLCIVPLLTDDPRRRSKQELILQIVWHFHSRIYANGWTCCHAQGFFEIFTDTARNLKASRMACAQSPKHQQLKPGLPRDRRKYQPLYDRGSVGNAYDASYHLCPQLKRASGMQCVFSMARNFGARLAENWICNSKQVLPERKRFKARQPHFPRHILHPGVLFWICFCELSLRCAAVSSILPTTILIKCPVYFGFCRCHQLSYPWKMLSNSQRLHSGPEFLVSAIPVSHTDV